MCTVVIEVIEGAGARLLAVRDEDPARPWDGFGAWWPELSAEVIGIRDRRAGGAWMALDRASLRVAVLLNRADSLDLPDAASRGSLALASVLGQSPVTPPNMHGFNLLEVSPEAARVISWDGVALRETPVPPGVHMIAHDDLDDPRTPRIAAWLPEFRSAAREAGSWPDGWLHVLAKSAELRRDDDRAIVRDNRPHGYPTQSLLACTATVGRNGVAADEVELPEPRPEPVPPA